MSLGKLIRNLKSVDSWKVLKPILRRYREDFVRANQRQLGQGELNTGDDLEAYRSQIYLDFKKTLPTYSLDGVADLYKTGRFSSKIYAKVDNDGILFDSKDSKRDDLVASYSIELFGITPEEWEIIKIEKIAPEFKEALAAKLLKR